MALADFIPVLLFGAAAMILQRDLYNKMTKGMFALFCTGTINVFQFITEQNNFFDYSLKHIEAIREYQLARAALYAPTF